jgi:RND family efflux transporter MFP subunit
MRALRNPWIWLLSLGLIVGAGVYVRHGVRGGAPSTRAASVKKIMYHCPMHPNYISDHPGECPICGMSLVPIEDEKAAGTHPATAGKAGQPGLAVEGQATIYLDPEKQQLIGLRTEPVRREPLDKTVRAVGQVTADETRVSRVFAKVSGWVDKLYVNSTGATVKKGQPLLAIYSPELVSTQEEYLLALRARETLKESSFADVAGSGDSLVEATRRRLELWDIPASEIRRIEKAGRPIKDLTLYSPASGYVMEKTVLEGQKIDPSTSLMTVSDLSEVWVQPEFYEQDASLVRVGDRATLTVSTYPGRSWSGTIDYIYPSVDPQTRTLRARLRFPNPGMVLKPGAYAAIEIAKHLGERLTVSEDSVLDSGTRQIVFLSKGDGHFEPRQVNVGERAGGRRILLSGLRAGDVIVSSGNFLVDSESRLKSAMQGMSSGGKTKQPAPPAGTSSHAGHGS